MTHPRSHLARHQPVAVKDDDELRAMAKAAWHQRGAALIWVDELTNEMERQFMRGIADREYGQRHEQSKA